MTELKKLVGDRLKSYRKQLGLSQEKAAERAGVHSTYIGQVERGEKNATIISLYKIAFALGVPLDKLFANIPLENGDQGTAEQDIPLSIYNMMVDMPKEKQETVLEILESIIKFSQK